MAYPPAPQPAQPMPQQKTGNGFGVTALVLGLIGLIVFAWIPVLNVFTAIPLGVLAIIFGIVALAKAGSRGGKGKGTGGSGLILGILAVVAAIAMNVFVFNELEEYSGELYDQYIEDCTADGTFTEQECKDMWDDAESEVWGN